MYLSLSIIISHVTIIYLIRKQLDKRLPDGHLKDIILDGLFAFELGCLAQEQGIILQFYGVMAWSLSLFCVVCWQVVAWPEKSASPVPHILTFKIWGWVRTLIMLASSLFSYRYMGNLWEFGMSEFHFGRMAMTSIDECHFPFKQTPILILMFTECIGSAFLEFTIIKVMTNVKLINNDPDRYIRGVLVGGLVTGTVVLFMDISGSMMNPTLATLLLGGCTGQSTGEHLAVYWFSPVLGAWAGQRLVSPSQPAKPVKIKQKQTQTKSQKKLKSN